MRTLIFALALLLPACWQRDAEAPKPQPLPKTPVDVALGCLTDLQTCEDWTPSKSPNFTPRSCPLECDTVDFGCLDEKRDCERRNREDAGRVFQSACQMKATACVRLVEAASPVKEIHHHR